ncbi:MAG: hypothetical protein WB562_12880 [Candidatus Sulfotelmatobacter sp.]
MKKTSAVSGCVVLFFVLSLSLSLQTAWAQSPLPLGSVTGIAALHPCPMGYFPGASCFEATVSCPNTLDIRVTYGFINPEGVPRGMVVFFNGSGGTTPYGGSNRGRAYTETYAQAGFQIVQSAWETDWEDSGISSARSVKTAACRPATLLNYFHQILYEGDGGMCAQGASAGSAALAYILSWYGGSNYLDKVELLSGPVLSDIEQGCAMPKAGAVSVCSPGQFGCEGAPWVDKPQYVQGAQLAVSSWTGHTCQPANQTLPATNASWKAMSIVDGSNAPDYSYPQTALAGWLCSNGLNNSAAEGQIFYQKFSSRAQTAEYSLNRVDGCGGSEGLDVGTTTRGQNGFTAISSDMTDPVAGCIKRH